MPESTGQVARLRPDCAKHYPSLDRQRWYRVTRTDDFGVFLDLENPKLFLGSRFVRREDVEVRDASEPPPA
jgi:hypothetical protein